MNSMDSDSRGRSGDAPPAVGLAFEMASTTGKAAILRDLASKATDRRIRETLIAHALRWDAIALSTADGEAGGVK